MQNTITVVFFDQGTEQCELVDTLVENLPVVRRPSNNSEYICRWEDSIKCYRAYTIRELQTAIQRSNAT